MKLPISLLLLATLGQAASGPSAKTSESKSTEPRSSVTKQKADNQTSKRELYEGNFGDRSDLVTKFAASRVSPKIEYAEELQEPLPDQSPVNQIFGARLPHIAKISDVLSGQGSFEAAVANHLYAPVSIYQARHSAPTSFEVPVPAASQIAYPRANMHKSSLKKVEEEQKTQEQPKAVILPRDSILNVPVFSMKQPRIRFESYSNPFALGFGGQPSGLPNEVFRPRLVSGQPSLFPVYDHLGPHNMHYLQQHGLYQFLPVGSGVEYTSQDDSREEIKAESTEQPKLQEDIIIPKQNYHAHPNGAISFASFSQNLQDTQDEKTAQPQPVKLLQQQPAAQPRHQHAQLILQKQKSTTVNRNSEYPQTLSPEPILNKYIHELQKYQPGFLRQPNIIFKTAPIESQNTLNALRDLLLHAPSHMARPHLIAFPRLPAFKPLPQSELTPESFYETSSPSPSAQEPVPQFKTRTEARPGPRPFGYGEQSTEHPGHVDQPIAPVSPQRKQTPLPPLKPNYNKHVKPLSPRTRNPPVFLPTPVQPLPTTTPKVQLVPDQIISSTTIQPEIKAHKEPKELVTLLHIKPQLETTRSLEPELVHQSHSPQTTTQQSVTAYSKDQPKSNPSTAPEYQSTARPQPQTSPREDDIIIQRQELKEFIFEPYVIPASTTQYPPNRNTQNEQEAQELQSLQHQQLLEQLQHPQFQHEIQEMHSQQYQVEARHLKPSHQQPDSGEIQAPQYQIQQYPQQHHLQPHELQTQQHTEHQQQRQEETAQTQAQQYQQRYLEPKNTIEVTAPKLPPREPETQEELQNNQRQPEPQPQFEYYLQVQPKRGPQDVLERISAPSPYTKQPFAIVPDVHSVPTQLYAQPNSPIMAAQSELDSPLAVSTYPDDVQFFGKFAEALFASLRQ